jgi:ParB/RepB/Spo0J family partition protein
MTDLRSVELSDLVPSRNSRSDLGDLTELAESIREHGVLQPVRVRPAGTDKFQVIAGHRRVAAARRAGLTSVPAVVANESDEAVAVQNVVENLQRENLSPLDLARGIRELQTAYGLDIAEIARALSKSPNQVRTLVRASRLPDSILQRLESGEGGTQVVQGLTVRHIERLVGALPLEPADGDEAVVDRTAYVIGQLMDETERRGVRINAHQADEVGRQLRAGRMSVSEAIDLVTANPERFRYGRQITSVDELEAETWAGYRELHRQLLALVHRLRPEIASAFAVEQRRDLIESLDDAGARLDIYRTALLGQPSDPQERLSDGLSSSSSSSERST